MTVTASVLRELHRIHKQQSDLSERVERGPRQIRVALNSVEARETELKVAQEAYTRARVASDDKQLQLKQREDRIADLQNKLNLASSNKEYQALKEQIAADNQANEVLSDEILEALESLDQLQAAVNEATQHAERARSELDKTRARVESEQGGLQQELDRVQAELKQAEASLPADFRTEYQRIARVRGEETLAEVNGEVCGSCFQTLTPQTMNELYLGQAVICKSCACLLYLPENRAARD